MSKAWKFMDQRTQRPALRIWQRIPLHLLVVVPYVLQVSLVVGITGWLSLRNGQRAVHQLTLNLREEVSSKVAHHLEGQLAIAHQINQVNLAAIDLGLLNLDDFEQTGHFFWKQMQVFPVGYINFANEDGEFIGVERLSDNTLMINETLQNSLSTMAIYSTDQEGNRRQLAETIQDEPPVQEEAWYADAVKAGRPVWSQIYQWEDKPEVLSISSSYPVWDANHQLIGVIGVDLILSQISDFLRGIQVSPSSQMFVMERDGMLVASSSNQEPLFQVVNGEVTRHLAAESYDPLIQATAQYLVQHFGTFQTIQGCESIEFRWNGERQFIHITPWQDEMGLDWLIVVVVPESDFTAQINANTRTTVLLCLLSLAIAIFMGLLTSRWINKPIQQLVEASRAIAQGNWNQQVTVNSIDELRILSQSFNQMAAQLQESFHDLEARVAQRTAELADAKESAEAASHAKSEFLATMSHELRTPLNIILGFVQVMQPDSSLNPEQKEYLETINRSGQYLLSLINNILQVSKIEAGQVSVSETIVDLPQLLDDVHTMLIFKARTKGLAFAIEGASQVSQLIRTDESKLRQVLINLVDNAIKFTAQGQVVLRVKPFDSTHLTFEVEDTGFGIAPHEMQLLFNPFVQAELGRQSQTGTGLGLHISREYVRLMGGELQCDSRLGQGTLFRFNLPVQWITSDFRSDLSTPLPSISHDANASNYSCCSFAQVSYQDLGSYDDPNILYSLAQMPPSWVHQLYQAAIKGSDQDILKLVEQIPASHSPLSASLKKQTSNFRFDIIINLVHKVNHETLSG